MIEIRNAKIGADRMEDRRIKYVVPFLIKMFVFFSICKSI